jgi:Zn-finger nucleic acid-binding protein
MYCPECRQNLLTYNLTTLAGKKVSIEKCSHCHGFWLDHWEAGYLSKADVANLTAKDPHEQFVVLASSARACPHCRLPLVQDEKKKADGLAVFNCTQCLGSWFPPGQLLEYKKAQEGSGFNQNLLKLPLKSITNIAFPALIFLILAISLPVGLKLLGSSKETRTQAGEKIQKIHVIPLSSTAVIVSFKTDSQSTSQVRFGLTPNTLTNEAFQATPSFYQQIKLENLNPSTTYYYQILLKDAAGKTIPSEILNFTTQEQTMK